MNPDGYFSLAALTVPPKPHVSASQMGRWAGCPTKWALTRIFGYGPTRWTAFGQVTHKYLEDWLEHGTPPPALTKEGKCATAGLHLLPPPGQAVVEHPLVLHHGGVKYIGRIDMLFSYEPGRIVYVGDHKTTASLDYAMSVADLAWDSQRVLYSHWAAVTLNVPWVGAAWVYYQRSPPVARPVWMVESALDIADRFELYHQRIGLAIKAAEGRPVSDLPRNLQHCNAYGGCPFRASCLRDIPTHQRAFALLNKNRTSTP